MKRIILLTQWFEPEPNLKGLLFARELTARGYEVEVVTGFPNYPDGVLYPGYRMSWRHSEVIDGVPVTRLPLYPSHDASPARRIANYVSFSISATIYCLFQAKRADIVYVYQLPTLGWVAILLRAIWKSPVVLDVMDIWPDTLGASEMVKGNGVLRAAGWFSQSVYQRVDALVALSPGFCRVLGERGVPAARLHLIYNWCDERSLTASSTPTPSVLPQDGHFNIVFAGNMGTLQGLTSVLEAALLLQDEQRRIRFVLIGGGLETEHLKTIAQESRLENVVFLPRVSMEEIGGYLQAADALLVHLKAQPIFEITIPSKTQAYMAMGKPLLMATRGDATQLVLESGCGIEARPEDPESIAQAARELAALPPDELLAMGARAKEYYAQHLSLSVGVDRFLSVFDALHG